MERGPTRKLSIAAGCVAAFAGFVALTEWTSSGDVVAHGNADLATFCYVVSSSDSYRTVLEVASNPNSQGGLGRVTGIEDQTAQFLSNTLIDRAPAKYQDQAAHAVEGLQRALQGDLTPSEAQGYVHGFDDLVQEASHDCAPYAGSGGGFGPGLGFSPDGSPDGSTDSSTGGG
jgi:hypothetical protein